MNVLTRWVTLSALASAVVNSGCVPLPFTTSLRCAPVRTSDLRRTGPRSPAGRARRPPWRVRRVACRLRTTIRASCGSRPTVDITGSRASSTSSPSTRGHQLAVLDDHREACAEQARRRDHLLTADHQGHRARHGRLRETLVGATYGRVGDLRLPGRGRDLLGAAVQEASFEQRLGRAAVDHEPRPAEHGDRATVAEGDGALDRRRPDPAVEIVEGRLHPGLVDGDLRVVVAATGDDLPHASQAEPGAAARLLDRGRVVDLQTGLGRSHRLRTAVAVGERDRFLQPFAEPVAEPLLGLAGRQPGDADALDARVAGGLVPCLEVEPGPDTRHQEEETRDGEPGDLRAELLSHPGLS